MSKRVKKAVKRAKLAYLWVTRILLVSSRQGVSLPRKLALNVNGGYLADQHVLYDFDHQDRKEYLSEFDWYRSRYINAPFDSMLNNKVIATEVLQHHAKVPEVLLIKNRGLVSVPGDELVNRDLRRVLDVAKAAGSSFMKPIGAGKGIGVRRLDLLGDQTLLDGAPVSTADLMDLFKREDAWFLSRAVEQHPDLAGLFPGATNTVRIITLRDPESGKLEVFFAVLRIGTKETAPVDNGSRGGLVARVDLETGAVSRARRLWESGEFAKHPDTGATIGGFVVPKWSELVELALRLAAAFPYLHLVAWDMLVAEDGIYVVEANTSTGVNIIQMWGPQREGRLGEFFRAHGAIK